MYFLGIDLGTSSVKASLFDASQGQVLASSAYPKGEARIETPQPGWAEQNPEDWWIYTKQAVQAVTSEAVLAPEAIQGIGIAYQMHGLVLVDKDQKTLRNAIIWCDSRAVEIGETAFQAIGPERCHSQLLNSPGNFTASKLKWVKDNEPDIFARVDKILLPGDFIAMKLTGATHTTCSGLSEGIFWDFQNHSLSRIILDYFAFPRKILPEIVPTFAIQGTLKPGIADHLGLAPGTPITYRAGDQPNNALALNVLDPGEVAATAGTSGVIYGVTDQKVFDPEVRINTFAHVNHRLHSTSQDQADRLGILLCINGAGSAYRWAKETFNVPAPMSDSSSVYGQMNELAAQVPVGADGLLVLPFGNGAERVLGNRDIGCVMGNIDFNRHSQAHIYRAIQEGIAFAMNYGLEVIRTLSLNPHIIRAGKTNLFQSPVFCEAFSTVTGIPIELYETDGACGAALGAAKGAGYFPDFKAAFSHMRAIKTIEPDQKKRSAFQEAYARWEAYLKPFLFI